ncbi:phosphoenolpyruvate--protein phosphotransferase [Nisaea acidiphila]|uniref:phosphoenolpyruvate--protein phosphotransferase n=1 Tax=Nisaea acidiphila TaxID=1862145 RepID=A0A9J7B173_9PROT|nr:phosphoenolpyruvate--protein phosphotransferase [Nisaea acidiphila]UUX51421.1 phosphoenolpyruvate--protein phosphotransferase [Nisaea acidiphila]
MTAAVEHNGFGRNSRSMLRRLRDVMAEARAPQERLDSITSIIAADMAAEVCSVYVRRADNLLELCSTEGLNQDAVHRTLMHFGEGLVGDIAARAQSLALSDAQSHPKFAYRPETGEEIYQSLAGVPVMRADRLLGVLVVQNRSRRQYSDEEIETLETFAMVLAELLANGVLGEQENRNDAALRLTGQTVAPGIGIGIAHFHRQSAAIRRVVADNPAVEKDRLESAMEGVRSRIDTLLAAPDLAEAGEHRDVLETFRMIAHDRGWLARMNDAIDNGLTAEAAVQRARADMRARLGSVQNPYLRERLADFEDLANRLIAQLADEDETGEGNGTTVTRDQPYVVVARSMGPAELLDYDRHNLNGLVLEEGSATAHVAIVARALDIPVLGNIPGLLSEVNPGDRLIVDADNNQILLRPTEDVEEYFHTGLKARAETRARYQALRDLPAQTLDGVDISLLLNVGLMFDLQQLDATGATGVGLYRTEIPFMVRRDIPDVKQQTDAYRRVLEGAGGRPVTFRTLDAGGDKHIQAFDHDPGDNPALGWRSLRISVDHPSLLRNQLRAILRAADGAPVDLMFPMVSTVGEFDAARSILDRELEHAIRGGEKLPSNLRLGSMLEVPSLAWQLPEILSRVDFLSVGSNDLQQFFFAADRGDQRVTHRYDPVSVPFLRLLKQIADACEEYGKPLTLCGEMAGSRIGAMALVGIGYRRLSMAAASIGPVKETIRAINYSDLETFISNLLKSREGRLVEHLKAFARDHQVPA